MPSPLPSLLWYQRQRKIQIDLPIIKATVQQSLPLCVKKPRYPHCRLPEIIEITFLNNRSIAHVHAHASVL